MKNKISSQEKEQKNASVSQPATVAGPDQNGIDFAPSADEVARRAYFSYVNEGGAPGRDVQHWLAAEAELISERNLTRVHGYHQHPQNKTQSQTK